MGDDDDNKWWREALLPRLRGRGMVWAATPFGLLAGCFDTEQRPDEPPAQTTRADAYETTMDSLALQRAQGWNAGEPDRPVEVPDASAVDITGFDGWRNALGSLADRLRPSNPRLAPWYVPTLFQSLQGPPSELLRDSISPMHDVGMDQDFARGMALRALFEQAGWPADTALVVDAPGPRSLAVAAALADRFDPVFAFGNWPHPLGVVPAHETLAATLFYLPAFEWARGVRPAGAPPVWVLDSNRLATYSDAAGLFDNRYLVKLPSAAELTALGIRHVLYVGERPVETDDLNAAFVDLCAHGIEVKMVSLEDFERGDPARDPVVAEEEEPDEGTPAWMWTLWLGGNGWWYGGDPYWHSCFWESYGWYPHHKRGVIVGPPLGTRQEVVVSPPGVRHAGVGGGARRSVAWVPAPRPTYFGTRVFASATHGGFGQVAVHASRATGAFVGVRGLDHSGGSFGRSGSLGRVGGGGFSA
jgi:hypothetical protein